MENTRLWNPSICQPSHPCPCKVVLLTPMDQHGPPEPDHPIAEGGETVDVSRYRVVVEVALHDRSKPSAVLPNRFMHAPTKLRLDFQQFGSHPLADRFALHGVTPFPVLPADMRESQKVERIGLPFSSLFPVLLGEPPELNPARLVWV